MRWLFLLKEWVLHPWSFDSRMMALDGVSPEGLRALVERKLNRVLRAAVRDVPFYRQLAEAGTIDAANPQLAQFPILEKKDIRGREDLFISDRYDKRRLSVGRTSGSTGEPFCFYHASREFDVTYVDLWRGLARLGIHRGDRRVLVKGVDERPNTSWMVRARRYIYGLINHCLVIDAHFLARSEANVRVALARIRRYRPVYLHGYVSALDLLAMSAERWGIPMESLGIRVVVTESEKLYDFQRERIMRVFGCPVAENYGSVEFGMIAQPDVAGNLCINADHVVVEVDANGAAVLTNLDAYAFPFIRFRNGDCLTLCQKKRSVLPYPEIERVDGRVADTIRLPDGGSLQGFIVMYPISKHMRHVQAYQIRQERMDALDILVVPQTAEGLPEPVRKQMLTEMREIVGPEMKLRIRVVSEIPLTKRGKRRFVVSELERMCNG